ncbi:MAG: hypothetical protein Q8T08_09570 [Ignavibacteria bacterium]|nr:hypothetical protein [Ignavibacteria bacterium]
MGDLTLKESDAILRFYKPKRPGIYSITPVQCDKIKQAWAWLHSYDSEHEYTFCKNYTQLRKEKKEYSFTKKQSVK